MQGNLIFSPGKMFVTPTRDAAGVAIANPTPILVGALQDGSLDFQFDTKMAYAADSQFPIGLGRGKGTASGKMSVLAYSLDLLNAVVFGQTLTDGIYSAVVDTVGTAVPAPSGPYTITVTPPSSGTFLNDLGVINSLTSRALKRVASSPATGEYSVNTGTGVYTFAAADANLVVYINYTYNATGTTAKKLVVKSLAMGNSPECRIDIFNSFQGKNVIWTMPKVIIKNANTSTKLDDWGTTSMDFDAFADSSGTVVTMGADN